MRRSFTWRIFLPFAALLLTLIFALGLLMGETRFWQIALPLGLFALVLGWGIAWRIGLPLRSLARQAQQVARSKRSAVIPVTHSGEIGQISRAINALVEKLQAQIDALQSEQGTLRAMLDTMSDGVLVVDAAGRVALVNAAAERLFHLQSGGETIGRSLAQTLRHHQLIALWNACRESGAEQRVTLELPRQRLFIQGIAAPLGEALPGHILMLFQDLTRIRRLETVRRDFISNISHELRTPLASLKALAETLQSGALEDPPAARRFLARMETEVDALSQMVSELLELARIESGQAPLRLQPVPAEALLRRAAERLRVQAERKGLTLTVEAAEGVPPALADAPRLEQVLVNLLHNAIKFTPAGGRITLNAQAAEGRVVFSVQDTGIGIPREDLPRIFERFYKSDRARSGGGTGLGLAIAKHIVEAHGGKIRAESVEGEGSTFRFEIPGGGEIGKLATG